MKLIIFLSTLLVNSSLLGQSPIKGDSISLYDYLKKSNSGVRIKPMQIKEPNDTTSLIIIDGKIYRSGNINLIELKKYELDLLQIILDSTSTSGVKKIIIYSTRKKNL